MVKKKKESVKKKVEDTGRYAKRNVYKRLGYKTKASVRRFNEELRKALNSALITVFGLLIAFSWKDLINSYLDTIITNYPLRSELFSTLIITFFCVLGIIFVANFVKINEDKK